MEAATASPPNPTSSTADSVTPCSSTNTQRSIFTSPKRNNNSSSNVHSATPYSRIAMAPAFETLYEKSHDDICSSQINDTVFDTTVDLTTPPGDLNVTNSFTRRKRKIVSPDSPSIKFKRKRDLSQSEKSRKKISEIFKTPINYFANRRRTISVMNKSLNDSFMSSSGVFDVHVVENLNKLDDSSFAKDKKKIRKSLFDRALSSSKFRKVRKRRSDLNATKLSFSDVSVCDGLDNMNASCFPDFPAYPAPDCEPLRNRERPREHPGPSFSHAVVLTSFHSIRMSLLKISGGR